MSSNITEQLTTQVARLEADVDCLDRAVIENGVIASQALAEAQALKGAIAAAVAAAGIEEDTPDTTDGYRYTSFGDPVVARMEAARRKAEDRRRRIEASRLRLIAGGGAS